MRLQNTLKIGMWLDCYVMKFVSNRLNLDENLLSVSTQITQFLLYGFKQIKNVQKLLKTCHF